MSHLMVPDSMTKMLILQDRDMKLQQVESLLLSLPEERKACLARIEAVKAKIEASKQKVRALEAKSKGIESEIAAVGVQLVKYKNQQLMVKKNEEYRALIHEIEGAEAKISALESDQLEALYELDSYRITQIEEEKILSGQLDVEQGALSRLGEKEERVKGELEGARQAQAAADAALDNPTRSKYRQVARGLKFPVVVALSDHKCAGCHMRVSNAVDAEARAGREIITCDNCGRILYFSP